MSDPTDPTIDPDVPDPDAADVVELNAVKLAKKPRIHDLQALLALLGLEGPFDPVAREASIGSALLHVHPWLPATARAAGERAEATWDRAVEHLPADSPQTAAFLSDARNHHDQACFEREILVDFALRVGLLVGHAAGRADMSDNVADMIDQNVLMDLVNAFGGTTAMREEVTPGDIVKIGRRAAEDVDEFYDGLALYPS